MTSIAVCCTLYIPTPTMAERLIDLARLTIYGVPGIVTDLPNMFKKDATMWLARLDIAIRFEHLPPATQLRAIVEDWDYVRITREVF